MSKAIDQKALSELLASHCEAPHWYVAFSGGVDSTALLHLITVWRKKHPESPPLTALHINHGLQAEASEWENHCAWICRFLDVPFLALPAEVVVDGSGLESAAREARYALFESQLGRAEVLFLGHHQDDQVETFFLRLLRGAGVEGLGAMPRQRSLGEGLLSRPFLDCSRAQLERYVAKHGLRTIEDPSNADTSLDRNFLRREVLPLLSKRWPGYGKTITRAADHLAGAAQALEEVVDIPKTCHSALGDPGFPLAFLDVSSDEQATQVIRAWLKSRGLQPPDQSLLQEFLRQLRKSLRSARPMLDTGTYRLQRDRDAVYLLPDQRKTELTSMLIAPGETVTVAGVGTLSIRRVTGRGIWLAADEELELRWRRGGERARPASGGRSADLKKWLQEAAIPPWWRDRLPLLFLENQMLAVGGLWACHSSRWGEEGEEAEAPWELVWEPATCSGLD